MNDGMSLGERRRPMVDDDAPFIDGHRGRRLVALSGVRISMRPTTLKDEREASG